MWHKYCPFCSLCPRQTLLADVSTSWLSYMATSESLSTYIPGSHANRSELQHKMKPLSPGLHKLREIIAVDEIPPGPDKAAGKPELVASQKSPCQL